MIDIVLLKIIFTLSYIAELSKVERFDTNMCITKRTKVAGGNALTREQVVYTRQHRVEEVIIYPDSVQHSFLT